MVYLDHHANYDISQVEITIHDPEGIGSYWTRRDGWAEIKVTVLNKCGMPLRDILVEINAEGPVILLKWYPLQALWHYRNPREFDSLDPNEIFNFSVLAKALDVNSVQEATFNATITAEVVPVGRSTNWNNYVEIYPSYD